MEKPSILPRTAPLLAAIVETGKATPETARAYALGMVYAMLTPEQREQVLHYAQA